MDEDLRRGDETIAALILAAGMSQRMGQPKMVLPWGDETIIEHVASQVLGAGLKDVTIVVGGSREKVEAALRGKPVRFVFNPSYLDGEMLHSLQAGLRALPDGCQAALVVLGDMPRIKMDVIREVLLEYQRTEAALVIPSYRMRRGHPWLIDRELWSELLALAPPLTVRDFIDRNRLRVRYVTVEDETVLADLDTPEDYHRQRPG